MADPVKRAVIVAVRGTMSMQDCLTDAYAIPLSLAHLGMVGEGRAQNDLLNGNLLICFVSYSPRHHNPPAWTLFTRWYCIGRCFLT